MIAFAHANAALEIAVAAAQGRIRRDALDLTRTIAQYFQIDGHRFVQTDRIDLNLLVPVSPFGRACGYHNLSGEFDHLTDGQMFALVCGDRVSGATARRIVGNLDAVGLVVFYLDGGGDFLDGQFETCE